VWRRIRTTGSTPLSPTREDTMDNDKKQIVRIDLNDEQKLQVEEKTGKKADALELSVQELEERIAPRSMYL
jgi:hypothetical protein